MFLDWCSSVTCVDDVVTLSHLLSLSASGPGFHDNWSLVAESGLVGRMDGSVLASGGTGCGTLECTDDVKERSMRMTAMQMPGIS